MNGSNLRQLTTDGAGNEAPAWHPDGRHVLVHGQLLGSTLTRLYLVDVRSGEVEPFGVPGFRTSGHGSWDLTETVMAFDGKREPPRRSGRQIAHRPQGIGREDHQ